MNAGGPILGGKFVRDADVPVVSPANFLEIVGLSRDATADEINAAMDVGRTRAAGLGQAAGS